MASIATSDALIARAPEAAAGAVRAIVKTQAALRQNVERAGQVGGKVFPPDAAALITDLIRRDLPFYDATISPEFVVGMNQFARDVGILEQDVRYEDVVAAQFKELWQRG
jgi:ABC-type nitrate/sulfonate/bicarbonate transport system substrate-binding protein